MKEKINTIKTMLQDALESHEKEITKLNEENESLQGEIEELNEGLKIQIPEGIHNNIRTMSCIESLINNLDYVPINELEQLVSKYAVI